ncbi:MAG: lipopolysaccharide heptosyltransferase I [Desulfosarcina sp.]
MNILIVKLSAIGDVIHTLPALNAIRANYPHARITWLVEAAAADLVVGHRALDRVLVSKRKSWIKRLGGSDRWHALKEMRAFVDLLRDTRYDIVLDFHGLLKSGLMVGLARAKRKIGFGRGMQHQELSYLFLNERVPPVDMEIHALTRGLMLIEAIGIRTEAVVYDIPVSQGDSVAVDRLLSDAGLGGARRLVAINPMALWETKLWRTDRFAALADRLIHDHALDVVFTGGAEDRPAVEAIRAAMTAPAINLAGRTRLKMLAALYHRSLLLVSTDTGPMHLAAAVGTPVVALFGPTAPWRTGPFGEGHRIVRAAPPCSPCFWRSCDAHRCCCMANISVDRVAEAVKQTLAARRVSG